MNAEKVCKRHGLTEHRALIRKDRLKPYVRCIECYREGMLKKVSADKLRTKDNKIFFIKKFGGRCMDCKKLFDEWAMGFHHKDKSIKDSKISNLLRHRITEKTNTEINKCDLLCACCHRKRHHNEDKKSDNPINTYTKMIKSLLVKAFNSRCLVCGIEDIYVIYDFHHINHKNKEYQLSDMINSHMSLDDIVKEAKKCVMLCACCHMSVHANNIKIEEKEYINYQVIDDYKKSKLKKHSYCKICNKDITYGSDYCRDHYNICQRKVERPSLEELIEFLSTNSYLAAGRKYGVSDNAIRKWLKSK